MMGCMDCFLLCVSFFSHLIAPVVLEQMRVAFCTCKLYICVCQSLNVDCVVILCVNMCACVSFSV